jgi:hypothetical protein
VRIRGGERSLPRASSLDSVAPAAALLLWLCLLLKFRCVAWGWCDRAGVGGGGDLFAARGVNWMLLLLGGAGGLIRWVGSAGRAPAGELVGDLV